MRGPEPPLDPSLMLQTQPGARQQENNYSVKHTAADLQL